MIPFAFLNTKAGGGKLTGVDGPLHILNGQTFDLPEGSIKDYSTLQIDAGGTLRVTGNTGVWTYIGVKDSVTIEGTILCRAGYDGQATHSGGTFTGTDPWYGESLSYTVVQRNGGRGADGGNLGAGGSGGIGTPSGIGGGGGGGYGGSGGNGGSNGADGTRGTAGQIGAGGFGGIGGGFGDGSTGGLLGGGSGGNGGAGGSGGGAGGAAASGLLRGDGGGGGGYKGHHGKGIFLLIEGQLDGVGVVNCSGRNGFNGGAGGNTSGTSSRGGGAGAGGAGGSGGRVVIRSKDFPPFSSYVEGGVKGTNGSIWTTNATLAEDGDDGSVDISLI